MLSEQTESKLTTVKRRYKQGHYMRIKGPTANLQENTMITNIYAPNMETLKPIEQTEIELKGEINSNPTNFNTLPPTMDRSS